MGQYYYPTIIDENDKISYLYSHDYNNGMKLMEHSYIGNRFVNAVCSQIWKAPKFVAWIGDYAWPMSSERNEPYEQMATCLLGDASVFEQIFNEVMDDNADAEKYKITPDPLELGYEDHDGLYLINHTQKIYIDLAEYRRNVEFTESWDGTEHKFAVHPLPLLTACGNDRGGGDYHDVFPDYDKVGTWAFNLIELTDEKPLGYRKVEYKFKEE